MLAPLRTLVRALFRRKVVEQDLDDELAYHLARLTEEHVARGISPEAARLEALKSFGGLELAKEECRDARGSAFLEGLLRDLGYAARMWLRTPVFTAVVVLSLGLGVGANVAIYSLVHQILVQPLPARNPQELVLLSWNGVFPGRWWGRTTDRDLLSYPLFKELTDENSQRLHVFSEVFGRKPTTVYLNAGANPEPAAVELVTGSYFRALGVTASLGRLLDESDDLRPGENPVVVLAHRYWKRRLGGPADIVGRKIVVNDRSMTVIGVAEDGFRGVDPVEGVMLWMPTSMQQQAAPEYGAMVGDRRAKWLHVFGRLAPGVTQAQARAALQPWFKAMLEADTRHPSWAELGRTDPMRFLASTIEVSPASTGRSDQRGVLERPLQILFAATGLVLLLACLNVAGLLVARTFARRRELAVRAALGASSGRIARESCVQTGLLALGGMATGVVIAPFVSRALLTFLPETVTLDARIDSRLLLGALALGGLTAAVFGLAPALRASRTRPAFALKEQAGTLAGGLRLRRLLVVAQIALALVLLCGAGLFVRTLSSLRAKATYVSPELLTFRVDLSKRGLAPPQAKERVIALLERLRASPAIESAALSRLQLMSGGGYKMRYTIGPGSPVETDEVFGFMVSPGLFSTLRVPFVAGDDFRASPSQEAQEYTRAIVNQSFVRRYLAGRNPLGARLGFGVRTGNAPEIEIVGVVRDFPYSGLRAAEVQVFFPALEKQLQGATFFVRTRGPATTAFASIHQAVRSVDAELPVIGLRTLADQVDSGLMTERFLATLATAFAALAVILAMIGLYGVMSFIVTRRTREIGIRLALGSSRAAAVGLVARESIALAAVGVAIGLSLVWAGGRLVANQLYGVTALDPVTLATALAFVAVVAVAASLLPAARASAIPPSEALRVD
jgi:predicted permease